MSDEELPGEEGCVFCAIARYEAPAEIVHEWHDALAFVPLNPVTEGHLLVIPRTHVEDWTEDIDVTAETVRAAASIAYSPVNLISSAGVVATQSVFHLHLHIVPRRPGDGLHLPWTGQER